MKSGQEIVWTLTLHHLLKLLEDPDSELAPHQKTFSQNDKETHSDLAASMSLGMTSLIIMTSCPWNSVGFAAGSNTEADCW